MALLIYRAREYAKIDFGNYIDQFASTLFNILSGRRWMGSIENGNRRRISGLGKGTLFCTEFPA